MRRICCFCEIWKSGGIESFLNSVLLHVEFGEVEVDIVTATLQESVFTAGLQEKGIHFYELSGNQRDLYRNYRMFRRLLRERRYEVIHFNLFQGLSLYYARIAQQEGVPIRIVHSHGMGLRESKTKTLKLILHRLGRLRWRSSATDFWACSKPAAEFLFSADVLNHHRIQIIPNGIEIDRFRFSHQSRGRTRAELGVENQLLIGTVGRLSQEKNQGFLLEVFAQIHTRRSDSRLLLVGEGELLETLRTQAVQLGIADATIFMGASQSVPELLCAMDLFVFPSFMEGLGTAAVEAQAAGLPVLCSDRIPDEARITEQVTALPLETGKEAWAEAALKSCFSVKNRESSADIVKAAGFEISDVAWLIGQKYMEDCHA